MNAIDGIAIGGALVWAFWIVVLVALFFAPLAIWSVLSKMQSDQEKFWRLWSDQFATSMNLIQQGLADMQWNNRKLRYALDPKAEQADQEEASKVQALEMDAVKPPIPKPGPSTKIVRQVRRMDCPGCGATLQVPAKGRHSCPHCGTAL